MGRPLGNISFEYWPHVLDDVKVWSLWRPVWYVRYVSPSSSMLWYAVEFNNIPLPSSFIAPHGRKSDHQILQFCILIHCGSAWKPFCEHIRDVTYTILSAFHQQKWRCSMETSSFVRSPYKTKYAYVIAFYSGVVFVLLFFLLVLRRIEIFLLISAISHLQSSHPLVIVLEN